jgi:superfamily I DNA/RNA helicase
MKVLPVVSPTPEQLAIIQDAGPGVRLIRGAAGSGKTTTALLRLRYLTSFWKRRRRRLGFHEPVQILVLTYNRTLRGYIAELAEHQVKADPGCIVEVRTFGKWAMERLGNPPVLRNTQRARKIKRLGEAIPFDPEFLVDEVEYATGRFLPKQLERYVSGRRDGRGVAPRVDRNLRRRLIEEVIVPYQEWKQSIKMLDWNDLAVHLHTSPTGPPYQVLIVDEAQDMSANQLRAMLAHLAEDHSLTLILDAAQRIYPRGFTWREVGLEISAANSHRLTGNHRNTLEIAALARPLLEGLELTDDGTMPDLNSCTRHGPLPVLIVGRYSAQMAYAKGRIQGRIDVLKESVCIMQPRGGRWFDYAKAALREADLHHVMIAREDEWPTGPINLGLSTLHSAKGLEFDHVFILGLNQEVTPHGEGEGDTQLETLRRLLAMAITRARQSVVLGYKAEDKADIIDYLDPHTYEIRTL